LHVVQCTLPPIELDARSEEKLGNSEPVQEHHYDYAKY